MPSRKIVVAGGTGFVGTRLVATLRAKGDQVVVLSRSGGHGTVAWDGASVGPWAEEIEGAHAIINLAGETISQRWTEESKRRIVESRVRSVEAFCRAISQAKEPPRRWINASAIGIYGDRGDTSVDERSPQGEGFLAEVCMRWEETVKSCHVSTVAKTRVRIGAVLGESGGALPALRKLAKLGLGGPAGNGRQPFSWIHVDDLVGMIDWLLDLTNPPEVVNATAPNPVTNRELMRSLRDVLRVPIGLPAPAFGISLVGKLIGPDAELILGGARVLPHVAMERGYAFRYPDLLPTLEGLLSR